MHNQLSKKGRIALTLYFLLLLCIVIFGIYYDMSVRVILLFSLVYSLAAIGAYFGKTAKQKIALTLLFGGILSLWVFGEYRTTSYSRWCKENYLECSLEQIDRMVESSHSFRGALESLRVMERWPKKDFEEPHRMIRSSYAVLSKDANPSTQLKGLHGQLLDVSKRMVKATDTSGWPSLMPYDTIYKSRVELEKCEGLLLEIIEQITQSGQNSAQNYQSYTIRVGGAKCSKKLYKEVNYYGESESCNAA